MLYIPNIQYVRHYSADTNYTITTIGDKAFKGLNNLETVTLSSKVNYIGNQAFAYCTSLKSVAWPAQLNIVGSEAFISCTKLESDDLSKTGLTIVKEKAFAQCHKLIELKLPETLTTINKGAFYECSGLTSLTLPKNLYALGDSAFYWCYQLASVKAESTIAIHLEPGVFARIPWGCTLTVPLGMSDKYKACGWTSDVFHHGVKEDTQISTTVGGYRLTFSTPNSASHLLTLIGVEKMSGSGETLTIPEELTQGGNTYVVQTIGTGACQGMDNLTTLVLPPSLNNIESDAFVRTPKLVSITCGGLYPPTIESKSFRGFSVNCQVHIPYCNGTDYEKYGWSTAIFPGGIYPETVFTAPTEEGIDVTYKVTGLEPNTVMVGTGDGQAIDAAASGVLTLPQSVTYTVHGRSMTYNVTSVADGAFEGCTALTSVSLPATITSLGERAFSGCSSLAEVYSQIQEPFDISETVFENISAAAKLYVPQNTEGLYRAKWWYGYFGGGMIVGETFVENGMTFLKLSPTTVSIGNGNEAAIDKTTSGALEIPTSVEHEGVTYQVTSLSSFAFYGCSALTSAVIPEGFVTIPVQAFGGCSGLESVTLPSTLFTIEKYAFSECSGLTAIDLPEGLTSIGDNSFQYCTGLTEVTLPRTITSLGNYTFYQCSGLANVYSNILEPFAVGAFVYLGGSGCVLTVPLGTRDAYRVCQGWKDGSDGSNAVFTSIVEDNQAVIYTVEGVPVRYTLDAQNKRAIVGRPKDAVGEKLSIPAETTGSLTIPETVEYMGKTYDVTEIGFAAFASTNITSVFIPNTVTFIGMSAFFQCASLKSAVVPKLNLQIFKSCSALEDVTITREDAEISGNAFEGCSSLRHITLPSKTPQLVSFAFRDTGLEEIVIPSTVTKLWEHVFYNCRELKSVELSAGLTTVGEKVFKNCPNIETIVAKNPTPVDITSNTELFMSELSSKCVLTVPVATREAYIAAGWTERTDDTPDGLFLKVVEETVADNHTFLRAGEGADVWVEWTQNGVKHEYALSNGWPQTGYLNSVGLADARLCFQAQDGYEVRILRNGTDITADYVHPDGVYDELPCSYLLLDEPATVDEPVTWVITVNTKSAADRYDLDGDGKVSITDVTTLVNKILGK